MTYNPKYDKGKLIIERIEFTEEQQQEINDVLEGRPTKKAIEGVKSRGMDVELWIKRKAPISPAYRIKSVKQKYKIGSCHVCASFPLYKLIWKLDGINLVEYYCEKHIDKITT